MWFMKLLTLSGGNPLNWKKHTGLGMSTWQILRNVVCTYAIILFVLFLNSILDFEWSNIEATSKITNLSTFFFKKRAKIKTDCGHAKPSKLELWNGIQGWWWEVQHIVHVWHHICYKRRVVQFASSLWRNASKDWLEFHGISSMRLYLY